MYVCKSNEEVHETIVVSLPEDTKYQKRQHEQKS